jgi:hypothetical protein
MTEEQKKLLLELKNVAESPISWGFANVHVNAIKLALPEIERLTTENQRLQDEIDTDRRKKHND